MSATEVQQWQQLIRMTGQRPPLAIWKGGRQTRVTADFSARGVVGVLEQLNPVRQKWQLVTCTPQKSTTSEVNKGELLAAVWCLGKVRWLLGLQSFVLRTNAQSLLANTIAKVVDRKVINMLCILSAYQLVMQHLPAKENVLAVVPVVQTTRLLKLGRSLLTTA
eukprot:Lankesteria_metandrocarpae@DN9900_c0_g1_i1.p1